MRLRQICLVAEQLLPAIGELQRILGLGQGFKDEGVAQWGLENRVVPLGNEFIEVVAPVEENTSAGRYLATRGGNGGYVVVLQCEDGLAHRKRLTEMGIRTVFTGDRDPNYWLTQYHPADCNGILLEIDSVNAALDYQDPQCDWPPAGPDWRDNVKTDVTAEMVGLELQGPDPKRFAELWSDILDIPVFQQDGVLQMRLSNAEIRFVEAVDGRDCGIRGLDIRVADRQFVLEQAAAAGCRISDTEIVVCGTRFFLV
ncbi:MAG: VOC family protein [Pseudomonadales bacterium]|jgi:hypothetical protein|nr:VOC family protein [Pseudomonadales bacterium]MDP7359700.1 VOC family protein [Pseudomonadales bacterium]MDP7594263.1 VOC family protein [Pseudomonadales bacterium]HJN50617.1 VOC family protein [Pseudomonadales bacterium]|tara:strand:+ start:2815 stop:3582 length:768 start_codon:yes stop_codon:yes gene_type:complete